MVVPKVMLKGAKGLESNRWILDSCCARHMKNQRENFMTFTNAEETVHIGNNDEIASLGYGTVRLKTIFKGRKSTVMLEDTLYTPDLMCNLISIFKAKRNIFKAIIDNEHSDPCSGVL